MFLEIKEIKDFCFTSSKRVVFLLMHQYLKHCHLKDDPCQMKYVNYFLLILCCSTLIKQHHLREMLAAVQHNQDIMKSLCSLTHSVQFHEMPIAQQDCLKCFVITVPPCFWSATAMVFVELSKLNVLFQSESNTSRKSFCCCCFKFCFWFGI